MIEGENHTFWGRLPVRDTLLIKCGLDNLGEKVCKPTEDWAISGCEVTATYEVCTDYTYSEDRYYYDAEGKKIDTDSYDGDSYYDSQGHQYDSDGYRWDEEKKSYVPATEVKLDDYKLYDSEGNVYVEGTSTGAYYDSQGEKYVYYDSEGNEYVEGTSTGDYYDADGNKYDEATTKKIKEIYDEEQKKKEEEAKKDDKKEKVVLYDSEGNVFVEGESTGDYFDAEGNKYTEEEVKKIKEDNEKIDEIDVVGGTDGTDGTDGTGGTNAQTVEDGTNSSTKAFSPLGALGVAGIVALFL